MDLQLGDTVKWLCTIGSSDVWLKGLIIRQVKDDLDHTDYAIFKVRVADESRLSVRNAKTRWVREDQLEKI